MEVSPSAANFEHIQTHVKKARQDVEKIDNERVNPFKIIASFPSIKERIDKSSACENSENSWYLPSRMLTVLAVKSSLLCFNLLFKLCIGMKPRHYL